MRLKLLSIFLSIQFLSFGIWNLAFSADRSEKPSQAETTDSRLYPVHPASHPAINPTLPKVVVSEDVVLMPRISTQNMAQEERMVNALRQDQIQSAFAQLPKAHVESVKTILLDFNPDIHRGLGGNFMIIIRAIGMTNSEFVGVLIHELAHNVDYAHLTHTKKNRKSPFKDGQLPLYETDPSLDFYRLSWLRTDKMRSTATDMDFVSGYAMANPFEDFAETYAYYVLHNKDFKTMAATSKALQAKYDFMKNRVFDGLEFDTADGIVDVSQRPWDTTVLPYDYKRFMARG